MVEKTDDAVVGEIIGKEVFRVDHPVDGPELYYTTLFIRGESLYSGQEKTASVTFPGGFIDENNGVYNSEAPSADEIRNGNVVVAFYKWSDNMGGDVAANALYASHGGLYTTFETSGQGTIVQGRGDGYAIAQNTTKTALKASIQQIRQAQRRDR